MVRHIFRHLVRAPGRSLLVVAVALLFTTAMGLLQNTMATTRAEIERVYNETIVEVEIRLRDEFGRSNRPLGDFTPMAVVRDIFALGVVYDAHLEGVGRAFISNPLHSAFLSIHDTLDILVGVDSLSRLTEDEFFGMEIHFGAGFDENDFVHIPDAFVPIIVSSEIAQSRNLSPGDFTELAYYRPVLFRQGEWQNALAVVIGTHDGGDLPNAVMGGAMVPLDTLTYFFGDFVGFFTTVLKIDPSQNRQLDDVIEGINWYLQFPRYPWREPLAADFWDQELRFGVAPLEQHLTLLTLLFPITVTISAIIGASLAILTMLQNAKFAAIMRVLGMGKLKTLTALWVGQIVLCMVGALIGLLIVTAIGLRNDLLSVILPYLTGAIVGTIIGAILITNRSPLDLLQVRE